MKRKSKKLLAILTTSLVAALSSTMVFASACAEDPDPNNPNNPNNPGTPSTPTDTFPVEPDIPDFGSDDGYTVATSGITLGNTQTVTGETKTVSTAADLSSALQSAAAGDTIIIKAGTYEFDTTQILRNSGVYNGYITVRSEDGADVILDFSEQPFDGTQRGVQIYGDYWYWYGVEIVGAGDNGMFISGNYNIVEYCEFHNNRDTGLQLGREESGMALISQWPSYNLIKNCTSYNNYDNETKGENADGFAAKLTVGYGNVFDGCIAYRNSDDGWDLYAYQSNGDIGAVILYNCVAFENGYLGETVDEFNAKVTCNDVALEDGDVYKYTTQNGDGNGFKLGGSVMRGNVKMYNCMSFNNRMHGVTDNSNPGVITVEGVTSYNNGADIDTNTANETFGEIVAPYAGGIGEGNNIDVARSETSYNNLKDVLSVVDEYGGPGNDAYKGSVTNSIFYAGGTNYRQFTDYVDAYSEESGRNGTAMTTAPVSTEVFTKLPFGNVTTTAEDGTQTTEMVYNLSGLENGTVHETYRNADGSINMGDILAITDPATVSNTGATLNKSSWDEYTHFYDTGIGEAAAEEQSVLLAVYNTLYLYTDAGAVYQDFTLTTAMMGATISWSSNNDDILHIVQSYNSSNSGSQDVAIEVYRPAQDTEVTLTAYINYRGNVAIKRFDITVKAAAPSLGDVYVEGLEDAVEETDRRFLIDQYEVFTEPELVVQDGSDMNGKTLAESLYTVEAKYEYATSATSAYSVVGEFSPSVAGVYRITYNVTCGDDTASYTYYIYVASNTADIDFVEGTSELIVNRDGYTLGGELTNVKGTLYSYSTTDTAQFDGMTDAQIVAAIGEDAASHSFTDNTVLAQFENANDQAYTVYYWFTNGAGDRTSEVYSQAVTVETIATPAEFSEKLASNNSHTIYLLTADLDFSGVDFVKIKNLNGLINGDGHTIKNVTISGSSSVGMFEYISGGTLMNTRFEEISITATGQRAGIFARSNGGYISNVLMENVNLNVAGRAGALIGHHNSGDLYIDNVALVNDDEHLIRSSSNDIGGIVGFVQGDSGKSFGSVTMTDCFIQSVVDGTGLNYIGGMVGRMEDRSVDDSFTLERCYSMATVKGQNYVGGVLAAQNNSAGGEYVVTINNCVFLGEIEYAGNILTMPEKNSSGIFGRYVESAVLTISGCVSNIAEDGYAEYVTQVRNDMAERESFWTTYVRNFDLENTWTYVRSEDGSTLVSPYIQLTFGGIFDAAETPAQ